MDEFEVKLEKKKDLGVVNMGVGVRHLPLLVFVLIWMQTQRSFPLLFSLSPVIASTLVLLGTLLFYGHGSRNNKNNNKGWETGSDFAGSSSPSASSLAGINSMLDDLRPLSDSELPFPQVSTDHSRQSADLLDDDDDDDDDDEGDTTIMENLIARQKALKLMRMQAEQRMLNNNNNNLSPQTNNYYHIHQSNMIPRRRRHSFDPLPAFQSVRRQHSFYLLQRFDYSSIGPYSIPEQRILHNPQTNNYLSLPNHHHIHESNPSVVRLRHSFDPPLPSLQSDSSVRRRHSFRLLPRTCHQTTLGQLPSGLPHTWDIHDNAQGGDDRIKEVKMSGYEEKTSSKSSSSSFFDVSDNEEEEYRSVDSPISEELQIEDSGVEHSATGRSQVHHRVKSWLTGWKA